MTETLSLLVDVALEARARLDVSDRPAAFRIVADWYAHARRASTAAIEQSFATAPLPTGHAPWDAMLAGLTEQLSLQRGLSCPRWAFASDRYLRTWWFLTPYASLHPSAFVEAPIALANRGVFIHRADFESV